LQLFSRGEGVLAGPLDRRLAQLVVADQPAQ